MAKIDLVHFLLKLEIDDEPSEDEENLDENFEETIRLMKEHKSNLKEVSRPL